MFYCGLDLAGLSSFVFMTDAHGKKVACGPVATTRTALEARFKPFVRSGLAIAIEAGNQTAWIYEVLVALGAHVTVVNPTKVKLIAERGDGLGAGTRRPQFPAPQPPRPPSLFSVPRGRAEGRCYRRNRM
jgi:hypothetical protein